MSSDNSLPQIGARCSLPSCSLNDFLPIRCGCQQLYCRDHIPPDLHHCPLQASSHPNGPALKLQRCAAQTCNKPSLESFITESAHTANRVPAVCVGCGQAFCAEHRSPISHDCMHPLDVTTTPVSDKNAAAKALLAKHFGVDAASSTARPGPSASRTSARKEAQQRQLAVMKMRHTAQPGNPKDTPASVPLEQRLHVKVTQADLPSSERTFWFPKTIGTGRALDMLATHFNLTISDSKPLTLLSTQADTVASALRTDQPLADQIPDGASLVLSR
ncbi:hypothetical protein LXA43DRAFT_637932 [Ganoderma leucocontextum]|nr:hypothetical protein LXA43DRAFT_637932 [Ganoderma leucocontextum]